MEGHEKDRDGKTSVAPQAWENTNTVFTNEKAGMKGVDKDKIKKVIYEMSKDSPHFKNEERKQQQTQVKIKRLLKQAAALSPNELAGHRMKVDAKISELLADRDLSRTWIHVDLDAFFASVEELGDPSLKTKPMGVGGIGMLSTANYVARRYGVRSAMPGFIARRLCPELVFVKPDFSKYSKASSEVRAVFQDYDPDLDAASLDEAYMDVTEYCRAHEKSGGEVAAEIRDRVHAETGLTCSCGVAANRMLAKVCSDVNKPNGQCVISSDPTEIRRFVDALPIRKVPGIGKVGEQELKALNVTTCADLIAKADLLSALFSDIALDSFLTAGLGLGRTRHHEPLRDGEVGRKGKGVERTFTPISATHELEAKCCELAAKLAGDLEHEGIKGKTLTLKLKPPNFELKTRAVTLARHISSEEEIKEVALKLLRAELPVEVRLMGLRMSSFYQAMPSEPGQKSLQTFLKSSSPVGEATAGQGQSAGEDRKAEGSCPPDNVAGRNGPHESSSPAGAGSKSPTDEFISTDEKHSKRPHPSLTATGQHRKIWTCQLCTFAENPHHHLRCLICDNLRGSTCPSEIVLEKQTRKASSSSDLPDMRQKVKTDSAVVKQYQCSKCGLSVPSRQRQEHDDFHIAVKMGSAGDPMPAKVVQEEPQGKKRKASSASITQFFRPTKP